MASTVIKNWDNKTWLSSQNYIKSFNNFLIKNINLNSNSKILDIGCGRGKILGTLSPSVFTRPVKCRGFHGYMIMFSNAL